MIDKFKKAELVIFIVAILLIFVSEYFYIILKNTSKAIFIGLWPPTILILLVYLNIKIKK